MFSVEQVHRVPAYPLPPGTPPRPFLFKMLNHKDKDIILSKARTMGPAMMIANSNISLFPDFSANVQKRRAQFTDVKKRMRALELQYAMLCPARLCVAAKGEVHFLGNHPWPSNGWIVRKMPLGNMQRIIVYLLEYDSPFGSILPFTIAPQALLTRQMHRRAW